MLLECLGRDRCCDHGEVFITGSGTNVRPHVPWSVFEFIVGLSPRSTLACRRPVFTTQ